MRLPTEVVDLISSFNGNQSELNCERGLRYMFLFSGKFFSWGLGNREQTLHKFLELYQPHRKEIKNLAKVLLAKEKDWKEIESHWASALRVKGILSKVTIKNDKNCCNKNKFLVRKAPIQNSQ